LVEGKHLINFPANSLIMLEVTFLGTSAGMPSRDRGLTSIALRYEGEVILFDCGENTQQKLIHAGLSPMKIDKIFITHWHADHFAGLPGLIQTLHLKNREKPLKIYGPVGTKKFMKLLLKVGHFHLDYPIKVKEIKRRERIVAAEELYTIYCTPVSHSVETLAYKFSERNKPGKFIVAKAKALGIKKKQFSELQHSTPVKTEKGIVMPGDVMGPMRKGIEVVYSGDTAPDENIVSFSRDVDLLIHDATYAHKLAEKAAEVTHSTSKQAGEIAKKANVKQLILTHISARYKDTPQLLKDAKAVFKNTRVAKDLMKIELK